MISPFDGEEYKASISQWKEFLTSFIWHDIKLFLSDRIEAIRDDLERTDEERNIIAKNSDGLYESSDLLRGRAREAKMLMFAPEEIFRELDSNQEDKDDSGRN